MRHLKFVAIIGLVLLFACSCSDGKETQKESVQEIPEPVQVEDPVQDAISQQQEQESEPDEEQQETVSESASRPPFTKSISDPVPVPNYVFATDKGKLILSKSLLEHKYLFVVGTASWNDSKNKELQRLLEIYDTYKEDVAVLILSMEPEDTMEGFLESFENKGLPFYVATDTEDFSENLKDRNNFPSYALIDDTLTIVWQGKGSRDSSGYYAGVFEHFLNPMEDENLPYTPSLVKEKVHVEDFTIQTNNGSFTLSETLADKDMAFVMLWASWCPYCDREFPYLNEVYEKYKDRIGFVSMSVEPKDTMEIVSSKVEEYSFLIDSGLDTANFLDHMEFKNKPGFALIDKNFDIIWQGKGSHKESSYYEKVFDNFLGEGKKD